MDMGGKTIVRMGGQTIDIMDMGGQTIDIMDMGGRL